MQRRRSGRAERCGFNGAAYKAVVKAPRCAVTIKHALAGTSMINIMEVAERLQDVGVQAPYHTGAPAQMYKGSANWSHIAEVKNNPRIQIPIFWQW